MSDFGFDIPRGEQLDEQNNILRVIAGKLGAFDADKSFAEIQAFVRAGQAAFLLNAGDQIAVETAEVLSASVSGEGVTSASVTDKEKFLTVAGTDHHDYEFNYTTGSWHYAGEPVTLSDYGLQVTGDATEGDAVHVHRSATTWDYDVLGLDEDVPVDPNFSHVLSIQSHKIFTYDTVPFDNAQYLFAVTAAACTAFGWPSSGADAGMPAGTYNITLYKAAYNGGTTQDGTYQFTTTQRIPIGGGIRHSTIGAYQSSSYTQAQIINGTFTTYGADTTTTIESGLLTTEGNGGTNLGTTTASDPQYKSGDYVNFSQRQAHGSNRWKTSYLRQYLNSFDAELNFVPATIWSRNRATKPEGFLHAIEPALRAVIGKVRKRYALPIADGYGYEDVEDYCTLSTMLDLGLGNNNSIAEGPVTSAGVVKRTTAYSFWKGTVQADRIKYQGSTARYWWLGSAHPSYALSERLVLTSGALNISYASSSYGVVPSLFII